MAAFDFLRRSLGFSSSREAVPAGMRGWGGGNGKTVVRPFEATSAHPAVPNVPRLGPDGGVRFLREQQAIAEQMERNDSWIQSLVRTLCDIHVNTGPEPVCPFPDLEELWRVVSGQLHNSRKRRFGAMLREDFYRGKVLRGEHFGRLRLRFDRPEIAARLTLPMQVQPLESAYVPVEHDEYLRGDVRFQHGVATVLDEPVAYAFLRQHPYAERRGFENETPFPVPADFVYHLHNGPDGSRRGAPMLATAFLRALAMTVIEDAERRRKQIAAVMSVFFKVTPEAAAAMSAEGTPFPDAERVDEMLRIQLGTGTGHQLPPGFDVTHVQPKDEPENFEKALRFQLLAICAGAGAPLHEVTGDWRDAPERAMRLSGAAIKRRAEIERDMIEHQLLDPMWRHFVEVAMVTGLWTPPPGVKPWKLYEVQWDWPVIQAAALTQELSVMMDAADRNYIDPGTVTKSYWGKRREVVTRTSAKDRARDRELGHMQGDKLWDAERSDTTRSIAREVQLDERRERQAAEESYADESIVDDED